VIGIVDWFSRKLMAYNVVNTMDAFHCVETLRMAIERFGKLEIFNSNQGSQFTSDEFIEELQQHNIQISMDGRGRCRDNAKMERFWWALKYEDIKIKDYVSLPQLRFGVQHYVNFYNTRRIHSALQYKTPDEVYFGICNPANRGYIKTRAFTTIFL
jgi:putative transposase